MVSALCRWCIRVAHTVYPKIERSCLSVQEDTLFFMRSIYIFITVYSLLGRERSPIPRITYM